MDTRTATVRTAALALTFLIASCGGDGGTDPVDTVTGVSVNPATATLGSLGATTQLTASATGSGGPGSVSGTTFTWSTSDASIVTVNATGLATAVANGSATITATAVGTSLSGSATVTVAQVAASITVTPEVGTITSGETLQLSATAEDAGGSPLATLNLSWSSSDNAIATVDATGLVSGVDAGAVTITAAQDGASDTSALDVIRADFMPTADVTLGGTVAVGEVMIPAGVTVTLTDNLELSAAGPVTIAGTVMGDCMGLTLTGQDAIAISGTFSNVCSVVSVADEPPALVILGAGLIDLNGSTITSSGDMTFANTAVPAGIASASAQAGSRSFEGMDISMVGADIWQVPEDAPSGADGEFTAGNGQPGHSIFVTPGDRLILDNTRLQAQDGGNGGWSEGGTDGEMTETRGGDGAPGGDIEIVALSLQSVDPITIFFNGPTVDINIRAGDGGDGGWTISTALPNTLGEFAPSAVAIGGNGANGGSIVFDDVLISGSGPLPLFPGAGGAGADGTGHGALGAPGSDLQESQWGGNATATGGGGGNAGTGPLGPDILAGSAPGGPGGHAIVFPGDAGPGNDLLGGGGFGPGNDAGDAFIFGGSGGNSSNGPPGAGGDIFASGANGGVGGSNCPAYAAFDYSGSIVITMDTDGSGPFINLAPSGSIFLSGAIVGEGGGAGAAGGNAGRIFFGRGMGGVDVLDIFSPGPHGVINIGPGFNGGDGGLGLPGFPGAMGGQAGFFPDGSPSGFETQGSIFLDGADDGLCVLGTAPWPVAALATVSAQIDAGTITVTGPTAWVTVTGAIAEDGTFTATGRGTVAGNANIAVEFTGTLDDVAGTFVGTYKMDTEATISPGHPVVYSLDLVVLPPALR